MGSFVIKESLVLEFDKEVVQFKLDGKVYEVRKPNNFEIEQYTKSLSECDNAEKKEAALLDWMMSLGLDKEVYPKLLPHQFSTLIKALYDSKKN